VSLNSWNSRDLPSPGSPITPTIWPWPTLHEQTGQAMEGLYKTSVSDHCSDLAHHYSRSGNAQKAVEYLGLAGHQAVQRSANDEAIGHFTAALELLQTLPDSPARNRQELTLQVALGVPLTASKSWGALEVGRAYARARELSEEVGDSSALFPTLYGLWAFSFVRAEHQQAYEGAEQLLRAAQTEQDRGLLVVAHNAMGANLLHLGELAAALAHLEQGSALYDSEHHHALAFRYGSFDPGVTCLCNTARGLWALGFPEQALQKSHQALAQALSHPFSRAFTLTYTASWLHHCRREWPALQDQAEAGMALSSEQGFPLFLGIRNNLPGVGAGRARARSGRHQPDTGGTRCSAGHGITVGPLRVSWRIGRGLRERPAGGGRARDGG